MGLYYIAEDGNWGEAEGLVILDDSEGTIHDHVWDVIREARDNERPAFASWASNFGDHEPTEAEEEYGVSNGVCGTCDAYDLHEE